MATLLRTLVAALLLFLVASTVVSADETISHICVNWLNNYRWSGANPPMQTVDVSFDFALVLPAGFTDFYFLQVMPGSILERWVP